MLPSSFLPIGYFVPLRFALHRCITPRPNTYLLSFAELT
jgi:hypothetical protein